MKDLCITLYKGFSAVSGETGLLPVMEDIRNGKYADIVHRITDFALRGMKKEAELLKKSLPYLSLTANYARRRLPHSIIRYNHAVTIDIDGLADDRIPDLRRRVESDPDVLACFLSPKQHGLKIFVFLRTAFACKLREVTFSAAEVSYDSLEKYHAQMYDAARRHIEQLTGVQVDTSGSDLSRGFFISSDPCAYLNRTLLEEIPDYPARILPADKPAGKSADTSRKSPRPAAGKPDVPPATVEPWEQMEYRKALSTTKRTDRFTEGNRDNFLYILGNRCYRKGISEASACTLILRDFGREDMDVLAPVRNAYTYISKTEAAQKVKEEKRPLINRVMEFLEQHYGIRRNVILDRLEFLPLGASGTSDTSGTPGSEACKGIYRNMRGKDYNSIFVDLQMSGIVCFQNFLKSVIDSDYAADFNPFLDYLARLPAWDGTDYIGALAATVRTDDQELWTEGFRRWLVGMVACALNEEDMNQLVLILYSEQGKGKSSWIRRLLPPQWKEYFYNGMIDPGNKDHAQLLSTRLIINMEEFEGVKPGELADLKRIITQENVTQRKVWDAQAFTFVRHASFIGSTNNRQCLQDIGGNRRFLPVTVKEVDYRTPVNHAGVYSQVLALLKEKYRYWFEGHEIELLNLHNELHRMKDPVEENLFVYFRKALPEDLCVKWMPAAAILSKIAVYGKVQVNRQAMQALVQSLEKYMFRSRTNAQGSTEYEVVDIQQADVEANFRK